MAEEAELELESESDTNASAIGTRSVKKNISIKLKQPAKATRGRPRKGSKVTRSTSKKEEVLEKPETDDHDQAGNDAVIEPPIFKQPAREPVHQSQPLQWNHKVNLIGEKVVDPLVHCCEKCLLPILIYGRMIPCKHVFCFDCAKLTEKTCPRCEDPVQRIEQSALGTVFICTYESTKHGRAGCRRTYLSQRDLQAHVLHRHIRPAELSAKMSGESSRDSHGGSESSHRSSSLDQYTTSSSKQKHMAQLEHYSTSSSRHVEGSHGMSSRSGGDDSLYREDRVSRVMSQMPPHTQPLSSQHSNVMSVSPAMNPHSQPPPQLQGMGMPPQQHPVSSHDGYQMSSIPVMSGGRTNLITVQLQDDTDFRRRESYMGPQTGVMPPVSFSTSIPPPGLPPPQFASSTMAPSMHQGPPPVSYTTPQVNQGGPSPFSSPTIGQSALVSGMPNAPVSHPPPGPVPPPRVNVPPPVSLHGLQGGPPRMNMPPGPVPAPQTHLPTGQPRYPTPHGHFDENQQNSPFGPGQNPRGPWTGPPQRPPPPRPGNAPMHPPPQRPQSDYGQFY